MTIRSIIRYATPDGRDFATFEEASAHQTLLDRCAGVAEHLPALPPLPHGTYHVHRDPHAVDRFRRGVVLLALREARREEESGRWHEVSPFGVLGRILDDQNSPVRPLWHRLMCLGERDGQWVEYEQPYFALHPNEAMPRE